MAKAFLLVVPAVLLFILGVCEGLVCYHCYSEGVNSYAVDNNFVPCNEKNLPASNTITCPSRNDRCVYRVVENTYSKGNETWRTCSRKSSNPCDPDDLPPGIKQIKCTHCGTDKCNLEEGAAENQNKTFTFNINANVNLYISQELS